MLEQPTITVRSAVRHPRLRYVLRVVGDGLGYRFRFFNDRSVFPAEEPKYLISYGGTGDHSLPAHPLLTGREYDFADEINDLSLGPDGQIAICQTEAGPDLLAAIFFCLSRYEEYQKFTADAHDRFPASASHAYRHGYLHRPVVREWMAALGRRLREWFPDLPAPPDQQLVFRPSYDIDLLWAYHYRGWRGLASGVRDALTGKFGRSMARFTSSPARDPYQTLSFLTELHERYGLHPTYFWLVSDRTHPHDTNPFPLPAAQLEWMRRLDRSSTTGLHPSYAASSDADLIGVEKARLEESLGRSIDRSRQHFLRLRLPTTYRRLLEHGIRNDYTMGYGDAIGWRAGTNAPFRWYDLEKEKETGLTVHPFAAMDVTLRNYSGYSADKARREVEKLYRTALPYGGPFMLLWHNSSFAAEYGWAGWKDMYLQLVAALARPSASDIR